MEKTELQHLLISWVTISLAFSMAFGALGWETLAWMPFTLIATGTGFLLHELAHRYVAKKYNCHAEYRMWTWGLVLALGMAVVTNGNFIFAAPGAVYIFGRHLTRKENGIISLAGPATNYVVGLGFIGLGVYIGGGLGLLALLAARINLFLGVFNMIPIPPLDGSKVYSWNTTYWLLSFAVMALTMTWLELITPF